MIQMKTIRYIFICSAFLLAASLFASCIFGDGTEAQAEGNTLRLSISTRAVEDNLAKGNDGKFTSLAIYIFNEDDGYCEYSEIITGLDNADNITRSVSVSNKTKLIYAVANFDDVKKTFSGSISRTTTMQELDGLTVNTLDFDNSSILMVGRKQVPITSSLVSAEVPMQRLVARLDFYLSKSESSADNTITVGAITMLNIIGNSNCEYQSSEMVSPVARSIKGEDMQGIELVQAPDDPDYLTPANAMASFYTYQYIPGSSDPDKSLTPYVNIVLQIDGEQYIYTGYITDDAHTANKYSLMRNTVYRVIGQFQSPDNKLDLQVVPVPWDVAPSEIGYEVEDDDYSFDVFDTTDEKSIDGIVQYPYTPAGGSPRNESSYVGYRFTLTAPAGAIWTATITNGLEFGFASEGSVPGTTAVSKGIAGPDPAEIRIKANKPWIGAARSTYLYITVNGKKLKINPLLGDGVSRKFPGDNDTDILIMQTEYQ